MTKRKPPAAKPSGTITDYVRQDLLTCIESGQGIPGRLTLQELSRQYNVSLTPVRRAVQGLIDEGVLVKRPNGRLEIHPTYLGRRPRRRRAPPPARSGDWETRLVDEIIARSLRGEADFLREEATSQRYGLGRTVIRQVFSRLAGKGLLEHLPRRGWQIRTFDRGDMSAYLEVREALEVRAIDLARRRLVREELEAMRDGNAPAEGDRPARLDNRLHLYLVAKSNNRYIIDFFERYGVFYTTLFEYATPEADFLSQAAAQHREVLQSLLECHWAHAQKVLAHHIRAQRPILDRLMRQMQKKGGRTV